MLRLPSKRDGRHDRAADLLRLARLLSFLAALGLGAALGWRLFLSPQASDQANSTDAVSDASPAPAQARQALIRPTGAPAAALGSTVRVGAPAPDFSLRSLSGETYTLSELRGQVVLLNFWTSWCPPCREEMPALQQAYEQHAGHGLQVLGVNWTQVDDAAAAEAFAQELGLTFPILLDINGAVSERMYQVLGLPTSVLIGRDGTVQALRIGALDFSELESALQALLAEPG